jgi:diguanylate cyclase (GGDEF)-like protein/PAS domain S-box-containing protein
VSLGDSDAGVPKGTSAARVPKRTARGCRTWSDGVWVDTAQPISVDAAGDVVLLIEGDPRKASTVLEALAGQGGPPVEWTQCLADGLERVTRRGVTAIILNLFLRDSNGIETFDKASAAARHIPILVLCADDEPLGRQAVSRGADDFLLRDHLDRYSLTRAVSSMLDRHTKENARFAERERAQVTLNSIGDAVLSTDVSGNVTYLNAVAEAMTGWSQAEAAGRPLEQVFNIINGATREPSENPMALAVRQNRAVNLTANCILIRRDGREAPIEDSAAPIHDRHGRTTGAVIVFHDVSAARQMSAQLAHLAQHDFLTDLPNRLLLRDRLQQAISSARRRGGQVGVLFLDLDRFKHVNDSLGHSVGDRLLQEAATRLRRSVRRSDTVGRLGGDEFVVVLPELAALENASTSAAKLLSALDVPYAIGSDELHVPASIGISVYPDDAEDADTLLGNADTAMYHAKQDGRNTYRFFKQDMVVRAADWQFIETALRLALERNQFSLQYQPKFGLVTRAVVGVEALLRWNHPDRGVIPAAQFVPIAESTGLILPIGRWLLREACRQLRVWLDAGLAPVPLSVNVSAVEFGSRDFVASVRTILREAGVSPKYVELELSESVLMKHVDSTVSTLEALTDVGVRLSVEDFGMDSSSPSHLTQVPIDSLKVNQSFAHEMASESGDAVSVLGAIRIGNGLDKPVIAGGVVTPEQLEFLIGAGCDAGQGYYVKPPMPAEEFRALLLAGTSREV